MAVEAKVRADEGTVYDKPLLYDIAFSYRDFAAESDAIEGWFSRLAGRRPRSVLELASGPADHAIEFSRRGAEATALDLAPAMCDYARQKAELFGATVDVRCGDMIDFDLGRRFDVALLMINSVAHVYDLDGMVRHLRAVARHLEPDGVYVLEVQHPRDFVGRGARPTGVSRPWTVERLGLEVETRWGTPSDPYDHLRQTFDAQIEIRVREGDREEIVRDSVLMRDWGFGELQAAIRLSGAFEIVELHGDFALDAPFDDTPDSWRMIFVLRPKA